MKFTTPSGSRFDTEVTAKSNLLMTFDANGNQVFDHLRLTGRYTMTTQFMQPVAMIEVEHSFGLTEVCEEFIWQ